MAATWAMLAPAFLPLPTIERADKLQQFIISQQMNVTANAAAHILYLFECGCM